MIDGQEVASELARPLREGGREHEILMVVVRIVVCTEGGRSACPRRGRANGRMGTGHTATVQDPSQLLFPVQIQHLIGFVDDGIPRPASAMATQAEADVGARVSPDAPQAEDMGTVHQVAETTGRPDQHVAATSKVGNLLAERGPAVDHRRTQHRAVAEATSLVEDLGGELARWRHDDDQGLGANAVGRGIEGRRIRTRSGHDLGLAHELGQHRDQEGGRLARAYGCIVSFSRSVGERTSGDEYRSEPRRKRRAPE